MRRGMNLLSANDYRTLEAALLRMEEITIVRTLGDEKVTARTLRADWPWRVAMIVQVRHERGNIAWVQNFESVEEARHGLEGH